MKRDAYTEAGALVRGPHRYLLWREWAPLIPKRALFVMLNPSTADATKDDPTLRRCRRFAMDWGCGALLVVNLFAWRATSPADLAAAAARKDDVVGADNDLTIRSSLEGVDLIVAAWGTPRWGFVGRRAAAVLELLSPLADVQSIELTADGYPRHPLYLPAAREPQLWRQRIP